MKVLLVSVFGLATMVVPFSVHVEAAELYGIKASASIGLDSAFSPLSPAFSRWKGGMVRIDNGNHYGWFNNNGNPFGWSNNNGNQFGWFNNGNGRPYNSVPIPGTLLLFGGGFAGFAAWRRRIDRRSEARQTDRPGRSLANHSVLQCKPQ
jgi:hypothetical protein